MGSKFAVVARPGQTFLPPYLLAAQDLCFQNHGILLELLRSGEEQGIFSGRLRFRDEADRDLFSTAETVLEWFEQTNRLPERAMFLRRHCFPAILSDFLHFTYEALECSRKAKLIVALALLRKPIQENLFVFEYMAADLGGFVDQLLKDPAHLHAGEAGGVPAHTARIARVLRLVGEEDRFDPSYLAQLRYGTGAQDSFAGICHRAVHLFTGHKAIRTPPIDVNLIFAGYESMLTWWYYLYSRLPYLLYYARRVIEYVCERFAPADPVYLADIERRVMASTLLWFPAVDETYRAPEIEKFVTATRERLLAECRRSGSRAPRLTDLHRMRKTGAYPGESWLRVRRRNRKYNRASKTRSGAGSGTI